MAIKGISIRESVAYIHPSDPGHPNNKAASDVVPPPPTIFRLGNLSYNDKIEVTDMQTYASVANGQTTLLSKATARSFEIVRRGLKGWDNFVDDEGNKIPFSTETNADMTVLASRQCVTMIPLDILTDIANEISYLNGIATRPTLPVPGVQAPTKVEAEQA